MDHELIHKTVADAGGLIVGGYMRAWISNGEPSNFGWDDIDVYGISLDKAKHVYDKIKEASNGKKIDFKYSGIVKDFYCNSWIFDGNSIYREKTDGGEIDDKEVLEQTQNKMATILSFFDFTINVPMWKIIKYMQKYNFTIHNPDNTMFDLKTIPYMHINYIQKLGIHSKFKSDAEREMTLFALKEII